MRRILQQHLNWESIQARNLFAWFPISEGAGGRIRDYTFRITPLGLTSVTYATGSNWDSSFEGRPCFHLDGSNDFIGGGSEPALAILGDLTLAFWCRLDTLPGSGSLMAAISYTGTGETEAENILYSLGVLNTAGTSNFRVIHENAAGVNNSVSSSIAVSTNRWYHVACIRDTLAKTYRFVINGVPETAVSFAENATGGSGSNFNLGCEDAASAFFDGYLSDVRIYNAALPVSVCQQIFFPETRNELWLSRSNPAAVIVAAGVLPPRRRKCLLVTSPRWEW